MTASGWSSDSIGGADGADRPEIHGVTKNRNRPATAEGRFPRGAHRTPSRHPAADDWRMDLISVRACCTSSSSARTASARCASPSANSVVEGFVAVLATSRNLFSAETAHRAALLMSGDGIGGRRQLSATVSQAKPAS
jgi:hypothetical protein